MSEMTPIAAYEWANKTMDAVHVDANGAAEYLPDLLGSIDVEDTGDVRVLVEVVDEDTISLTYMDDRGFRTESVETIYSIEKAEALGL